MRSKFLIFAGILLTNPIHANVLDLDTALVNVINNCTGIADELNDMKKMAGINTAITGVGTLASGGATVVGFVKQSKDKQAANLEELLTELRKMEQDNPSDNPTDEQLKQFDSDFNALFASSADIKKTESELEKLNRQSKNLGNWRTGLMAGSAATNVAGAIIAGRNKVEGDLKSQVDSCKSSINDLRGARMQARLDRADETKLEIAETILSECAAYDVMDVSKINKRASGAMWASVVGATTGTVGTITSAVANTDKTRNDNTDSGKKNEKNLNTASNVLAIGTTVASGTATVFNATQISAIKRASEIADKCEEILR